MKILPAIDLIDGACVRLKQGDFAEKKTYSNDPLSVAREFEAAGLSYLHLVDLDGARSGSPKNLEVLRKIAKQTSLTIDFGGGITSEEHLESVLESGASQVNIGSLAIKQPELVKSWLQTYGPEVVVLSADVLDGKIAQNAWQSSSELSIEEFLTEYLAAGLRCVACTDVAKDGMMTGPSFNLYAELQQSFDLQLIASGGVHTIEDVKKLYELGLSGVIIGKAIYEGVISLRELTKYA